MNRNPKHFFIFFLTAVIIFYSVSGCTKTVTAEPLSMQSVFFDTVVSIELYGTTDESLLTECSNICEKYENLLSRTISTSEISRINQAGGSPVTVSKETAALIQKGLEYGDLSKGNFDITIAPLSELWDFKNNTGIVPSQEDIDEARQHVNYKNVQLDDCTVTLTDPKAAIDLGGIAKGYIADRLKEYLTDQGIEHGIISLGGNVLTIGNKLDGSSYNIGIQRPFDEQNTAITTVQVQDKSVVSSGVYERYFESDGKLYHHILNPSTGYPFDNNLLGVTIISDASVDGDGLSTTCFALGLEKGMKLIESLDHTDAIFITEDYQLHDTRS